MFSQLFGKYLVEKQIITLDEYRASIEKQLSVRVSLVPLRSQRAYSQRKT